MQTPEQFRRGRRVIPRDGTSVDADIVGFRRGGALHDLYHARTRMQWRWLFLLACLGYLVLNCLFACLYVLGGDCVANLRPGHFGDALAFSVQTLATIGYGVMAPVTPYAHVVVAMEALCGVLSFALITGIVFAKFSRPTARVIFSDVACISPHDGKQVLMFRMANERTASRVVQAEVRVHYTCEETSPEGVTMRRFYDLALVRNTTPIFALSWTAMHVIDAQSPLWGLSQDALAERYAEIVVSFSGLDEHLSQPVHGRHSYLADELRFGQRFVDVLSFGADGRRVFDFRRFHDTIPVGPPAWE